MGPGLPRSAVWPILATLALGMLGWLALAAAAPIEGSIRSALLVYGVPLLLGALGGSFGNGSRGLIALLAGIGTGQAAAYALGLIFPPSEGEVVVSLVFFVLLLGLATVGYAAASFVRRRWRARPRRT